MQSSQEEEKQEEDNMQSSHEEEKQEEENMRSSQEKDTKEKQEEKQEEEKENVNYEQNAGSYQQEKEKEKEKELLKENIEPEVITQKEQTKLNDLNNTPLNTTKSTYKKQRSQHVWFFSYVTDYLFDVYLQLTEAESQNEINKYTINTWNDESDTDSLFLCIQKALHYKSKNKTDVLDIRLHISTKVTEIDYKNHQEKYNDRMKRLKTIETMIKSMNEKAKEINDDITKIQNQGGNRIEHLSKMEEANQLKKQWRFVKRERLNAKKQLAEYRYMKNITTLKKFKNVILDSLFHGSEETLPMLEQYFACKIIVFHYDAYIIGDYANAFSCGNNFLSENELFEPIWYILLEKKHTQYNLIEYHEKPILTFDELSIHIKNVLSKRMNEGTAGVFVGIPEFVKLHRMRNESSIPRLNQVNFTDYDPNVRLTISSYAPTNHVFIGEWLHEEMNLDRIDSYFELQEFYEDWRRILSNDAYCKFTIRLTLNDKGGTKNTYYHESEWATVTHYILAKKYPHLTTKVKKEVVSIFDLRSNTMASNRLDVAFAEINEPYCSYDANDKDELTAICGKFSDKRNTWARKMLLSTNDAKLSEYIPGEPLRLFHNLMKVRKQLRNLKIHVY